MPLMLLTDICMVDHFIDRDPNGSCQHWFSWCGCSTAHSMVTCPSPSYCCVLRCVVLRAGMTFGEFAAHTLDGYYQPPQASSRGSDDDQGHVPGTPDYPPAAKDVAPAAVHVAVAAAGRQFAQLLVSHE